MRKLATLLAGLLLASPAGAVELVFDAGTFTPAQTVFTPADQPVTIRCAGASNTTLIVPAGLSITYDSQYAVPTIEGCTLATDGQGGTALTIAGPVLPTATQQGPVLRDLSIRGLDVTVDTFARGIRLVDVWNPVLRDINVKGLDQIVLPFVMQTCVEFERSQVVTIERLHCYHAETGVKQLGGTYGEGFALRGDFNLVGVRKGVHLLGSAGTVIEGGHINAYEGCIETQGKLQLVIDGLLCYKTHVSPQNFVGLLLIGAQYFRVVNSQIEGSKVATEGGTTTGMVLVGVNNSVLQANICENFKVISGGCIVVGTQSRDNSIINNRTGNGGGPVITPAVVMPDAGPNNYLSGNKP